MSHIFDKGLLGLFSEDQTSVISRFVKLMSNKHKNHMKHFFRELLMFKYGKINLLKNKIMRKYMDRHMKVDQVLISKIQKLAEIRDKCTLTRKQETMQNLKVKVRHLNERR